MLIEIRWSFHFNQTVAERVLIMNEIICMANSQSIAWVINSEIRLQLIIIDNCHPEKAHTKLAVRRNHNDSGRDALKICLFMSEISDSEQTNGKKSFLIAISITAWITKGYFDHAIGVTCSK